MNIRVASIVFVIATSGLLLHGVPVRGQPPVNDPDGNPNAPAESEATEPESEPDDPPLPKYEEMELPAPEQLVKGPRVDWIVLRTGEVLVVQPVYPRPGTLEKMAKRIEESTKIAPRSPEERKRFAAQREEWKHLLVQLPGDDAAEYKLHMDQIERVVHHEDLVLERVQRLIDASDLQGAYELLFPLARREPDWPGLSDVQNNLLLGQTRTRLEQGRLQEALVFIEELFDRSKSFPGVRSQMSVVFDALITSSVEETDFRRARFFLARLRRRLPMDEVVAKWEADLDTRASRIADDARTAAAEGAHDRAADLVARAALVWPKTAGLRELHRATTNRWQRLVVGVRGLGQNPNVLPADTLARRRHDSLVTTPLFEVSGVDYRTVYRHRDVESWEPTDLGRSIEFSMRRERERWEPLTPLTASDVTASIRRRLDPDDPRFDERLAGFVSSVRVASPFRFQVQFRRTPLRPEALLEITTTPHSGEDSEMAPRRGRFDVFDANDERVSYRRTVPEPDALKVTEYHVAEIVERDYPTWEAAAQGLLREEVDLVAHVRPFDVQRLAADVSEKRFEVRRYSLPRSHVLQFNWKTPALRNQSFRRSLAFATNARRVMRDVVLQSENSPYGRLVTAPWSSDSLYYSRTVRPREHDLGLSIALRMAATKELKTLPELTLLVVGDDIAVRAAREIARDWKRSGITANVVTADEFSASSDPHWDVMYRTVKLSEPLVELWPFLVTAETARMEDLEILPDWLRLRLIELDRVTSWRDAEARLRRLQVDLYQDARYIPLWEVDDFFVLRNTLRPSTSRETRQMFVYDDIERWIVRPPYPSELK